MSLLIRKINYRKSQTTSTDSINPTSLLYHIKERFDLVQLLREVDFKQTRCNARDVLKNFRRLERMAGRSLIDIKSPIITDMPKAPKYGNKAEDAIIQMMDIEAERDAILAALMALSLISRQILYYSFCDVNKHSNYEIGQLIRGYGEKNVEKLKSIALIEFAEAYKKGVLVQYR